uniref:SAP domain-containing protein n=1 Tax=Strongyloides venezuelensis TaxID=75913 RepID=A0A0K0FGJ8_STRVS
MFSDHFARNAFYDTICLNRKFSCKLINTEEIRSKENIPSDEKIPIALIYTHAKIELLEQYVFKLRCRFLHNIRYNGLLTLNLLLYYLYEYKRKVGRPRKRYLHNIKKYKLLKFFVNSVKLYRTVFICDIYQSLVCVSRPYDQEEFPDDSTSLRSHKVKLKQLYNQIFGAMIPVNEEDPTIITTEFMASHNLKSVLISECTHFRLSTSGTKLKLASRLLSNGVNLSETSCLRISAEVDERHCERVGDDVEIVEDITYKKHIRIAKLLKCNSMLSTLDTYKKDTDFDTFINRFTFAVDESGVSMNNPQAKMMITSKLFSGIFKDVQESLGSSLRSVTTFGLIIIFQGKYTHSLSAAEAALELKLFRIDTLKVNKLKKKFGELKDILRAAYPTANCESIDALYRDSSCCSYFARTLSTKDLEPKIWLIAKSESTSRSNGHVPKFKALEFTNDTPCRLHPSSNHGNKQCKAKRSSNSSATVTPKKKSEFFNLINDEQTRSKSSGIVLTNPLLIKLGYIEGIPVKIAIDGEATLSAVFKDLSEKLNQQSKNTVMCYINGTPKLYSTTEGHYHLQLQGNDIDIKRLLINDTNYQDFDFLLGRLDIKRMGMIVGHETDKITFSSKQVNMVIAEATLSAVFKDLSEKLNQQSKNTVMCYINGTPKLYSTTEGHYHLQLQGNDIDIKRLLINDTNYQDFDFLLGRLDIKRMGMIVGHETDKITFSSKQVNMVIAEQSSIQASDKESRFKEILPDILETPTQASMNQLASSKVYPWCYQPQSNDLRYTIEKMLEWDLIEHSNATELTSFYLLQKRDSSRKKVLDSEGCPRKRFVMDCQRINDCTVLVTYEALTLMGIFNRLKCAK